MKFRVYVDSRYSSTVWLYLFFLPFQLADDFKWYTVPGTGVAAFFYLGFIAAGSSIFRNQNDTMHLLCVSLLL